MPQAEEQEKASVIRKYSVVKYSCLKTRDGGWEVNDSCHVKDTYITCKKKVFNAGTAERFIRYRPTDRQLARASSFKGCRWESGDGFCYEATDKKGKFIGSVVYLCEVTHEDD